MKKISVLMASLFFASSAYAGNFEGLSVFAKVGSQSTDTEINWTGTGDNIGRSQKSDGSGRSTFSGGIGADYGFKINEKFVTLLGIEGNLNTSDIYKDSQNDPNYSGSTKFKQKNTYGIYVAPGYIINDSAMVYAKFSYNRTKIELKTNENDAGDISSFKNSENFDGFGFGVGARLFVAQNIFVNAEWQRIEYSSEKFYTSGGVVKFDPQTTVGTLAIGYNF